MRRMNWGSSLLIACIFILALGPSSKAQERAGGIVVQKLTASETFVEPQALIGPQVPLNEFIRLTVKGDYIAAGVGMRNLGEGTININLPVGSTIVRSFLYWAIVREPGRPARNRGRLNGNRVSGTLVGSSGTPCWGTMGEDLIDVYRADVSTIVRDGDNILSRFPSGLTDNTAPQDAPTAFPLLEGASLVVIFGNALSDFNTVVIRDGAQTMVFESVATSFGNFTPVSGVVAGDEVAKTTYIVADGQARFQADQASFDSTVVAGPTTGLKSADAFDGADGIVPVSPTDGLWDTLSVDVSSFFTPDVERSADARVVAGDVGGDCLTWVAQVFSVKTTPPGFDFPVGNPNGDPGLAEYSTFPLLSSGGFRGPTGCKNQPPNSVIHPGEDWNSAAGAFSDRDDPVYALADGTVVFAEYTKPNYGNVVVIHHPAPVDHPFVDPAGGTLTEVWSVYYHMATLTQNPTGKDSKEKEKKGKTVKKNALLVPQNLKKGDEVKRGQQIGTIGGLDAGTNDDVHLHLEIRKVGLKDVGAIAFPCKLTPGDSESEETFDERYVEPSAFILANRATTPSDSGFWNFLDQDRVPENEVNNNLVDIFIADAINPELITLETGDEGMVPHSLCGTLQSCLIPSPGLWWYGVANHRHQDAEDFPGVLEGGGFHGTFIDWVFNEDQTPKNGGLSTVSNQGHINFRYNLSQVSDPVFRFTTWWEIESVDADTFDLMQVFLIDQDNQEHHLLTLNPAIDVNGSADVPFSSAGHGLEPIWVDHQVDLEEFAGQIVFVSFRFDSGDARYNGFRGWLIDRPAVVSFVELPFATNSFADEIMLPSIDPCPGGNCRSNRVRD